MDLGTRYLGLELRSPLVASSSPLTRDPEGVRRLEDAGIGAVVLPSVFEEQFSDRAPTLRRAGPRRALELVERVKRGSQIPVIASVNGFTSGPWLEYGRRLQEAGADALELNLYYLPRDIDQPGSQLEQEYIDIVRAAREACSLPIAVKLGPYFSNLGHLASGLVAAGADALVLFNRFYQPEVDLENRQVVSHLLLSTQSDLRLPLRWIALLYGRISTEFAATSGIYTGHDALKAIAVGAQVAMLCAVLLQKGHQHVRVIEDEITRWLEVADVKSVSALRGTMSHRNVERPNAFERAQYLDTIDGFVD